MENIQINRLNMMTSDTMKKVDYEILLLNIYDKNTIVTKFKNYDILKQYFQFMISNEWETFFVGNHEVTSFDIDYIQKFFDQKQKLENVYINSYNGQLSAIHDKFINFYKFVEFTPLESFIHKNNLSYIFVDLCWCIERGMRIYVKEISINDIGFSETEV